LQSPHLILKNLAKLDKLLEIDELVLIFSDELLEEFIEVSNRPRFRKYFELKKIEELLDLFDEYVKIIAKG